MMKRFCSKHSIRRNNTMTMDELKQELQDLGRKLEGLRGYL